MRTASRRLHRPAALPTIAAGAFTVPAIVGILCAFCAGLLTLALAANRPVATLAEAEGLYRQEPDAPYRWTSSLVTLPIHGRDGPTSVELLLGSGRWPGRSSPQVTLATAAGPLAVFGAPDQPRRYIFLLPPTVTTLHMRTSVERPPQNDRRWLGAQLFMLRATSNGLPANAFVQAALAALAAALLAFGLVWWLRRLGAQALTYSLVAALVLSALALRLFMIDRAPPGFTQDEAVSLVDAWNLAHTGRDHLGNVLPLGAFESFGDWVSPLLTYLQLPFVALFGPELPVGRRLTALLGALAVAAIYGLARALRLPVAAAACAALVMALSPWQIAMSRLAAPPSLVALFWTLCLWAAVHFVRTGEPRISRPFYSPPALLFALVAGITVYAYPTLKMAVPLLLGLAVLLAFVYQGWSLGWRRVTRVLRGWLIPGVVLALLWLPFAIITLFNPVSDSRFVEVMLVAPTPAEWLARWWVSYSTYFLPDFYYLTGERELGHGAFRGGVQLIAEAPLVVLGLAALLFWILAPLIPGKKPHIERERDSKSNIEWYLIAGAVLLAPLPASITTPSPYSLRATTIAPLYALLAGIGAAALWQATARISRVPVRQVVRGAGACVLVLALAWQSSAWYRGYLQEYPHQAAWVFQEGMSETMRRAIAYAPGFDQVWVDLDGINQPHIYLLALRPLPPAQLQQQIEVLRRPSRFNVVTRIGRYHFRPLAGIPINLPTLEAVPNRSGEPAFLLQRWQQDGRQILLLRRAPQ